MTMADCPNRDALQSLLDEAESQDGENLLGHLEGCTACQHSLETLAGDPASWQFTAAGLGKATRYEPALRDVVERLKDQDLLGEDDDDFTFLQPTDKPGLLGLLGDYEVQEQIGRGGMGIVLRATDPGLNRTVAIKVLSPKLATSVTARRRFVREGRAAAKVVHDHIVTVYGVQEADGLPYLIMQHVDGESLQDRLDREGPLESIEIVRIAQQAAAGLAAAHAHGLIHRDIKPANLLLEVPRILAPGAVEIEGRVRITDFGLARMVDDVQMTQHGMVIGTPEYMAPEQARGEAVDHRADLFSLGSVMYAMCTDRPPFRASSTVAVLRQVSDDTPVDVQSVNPDVPEWLAALVERLMQKRPEDRFQAASEVATLLAGFLAHERDPQLPAPVVPSSLEKRRRPVRSVAWLAFAIALALVPVSLWLLRSHFPAVTQEPLAAQPGPAAADEKKDRPADDGKKGDPRSQLPPPKGGISDAERKLVPKSVPPTPEQVRAIATLKRLNVKYKFDEPGRPIVHVNFLPGTAVDDVLEELLPLTDIGVMGLQGTQITDAGLKHVAGFKKMFQLYLGQTKVSDVGLKELAHHPRLEHLGIENTRVTDEGIHSLAPLKTLKYLNIGGTAITDGCMKDINGFRQMEMLCLYSTAVTDAGMKELKDLTKLRTILLNDTGVTNAGIKELAPLTQLTKINATNTAINEVGLNALKESAPAAKFEVPPVAAEVAPGTHSHSWLMAACLVVAVIALSFAGVLLLSRKRQEASKLTSSPEALQKRTSLPAPPHPIAMICPSCQRKLRAKAQQAGKAVKCPGCGAAVDVPIKQAEISLIRPSRPKG
jgi:serine/threonine protein kinase